MAQSLRITVGIDDGQQGRARCVRLKGQRGQPPRAAVLLRSEPRSERRQWALAHEIGEQLAPRVFSRLGVDPRETSPKAREAIANQMAGRLLLPRAWFFHEAQHCSWDVAALKRRVPHRKSRADRTPLA